MSETEKKIEATEVKQDTTDTATEQATNPVEAVDVQTQLQQLMVENARLKKAVTKATGEASDFKKKYNATLSEKEQADMQKAEAEAERQAEFEALKRQVAINNLEKNFLILGYSAEQANKASQAQYDGDVDTLFKIQSDVQESVVKAKEAEWLKSRPPVNAGVGGETPNITKEQFEKMGYLERVDFKKKYPETYDEYVK